MRRSHFFQTYGPGLSLTFVSTCLFLYKIGTGSLANWDEAYNANVVLDTMAAGKGFWSLVQDGHPFYDKPPLTYWCVAFFYHLFGISEFTSRLPSVFFGVGGVVMTYLLGVRLFSKQVGFLAGLLLMSTFHYFMFSRRFMLDMPLAFFVLTSLYCFWSAQKNQRYWIACGLFCGLAVLTKSILGLFVPPIIILYCLFSGQLGLLKGRYYTAGVLSGLLVSLPWFIGQGPTYLREHFGYHLLKRFTETIERHGGGWDYYFIIFIKFGVPTGILGLLAIGYLVYKRRSRRVLKREVAFLFSWIIVIFSIVTLSKTKIPWYIMSLYPALAIASAAFLQQVISKEHFWESAGLVLVGSLMINGISHKPIFNQDFAHNSKGFAPTLMKHIPEKEKVYTYNIYNTSFQFYSRRQVISIYGEYDRLKKMIFSETPRTFLLAQATFNEIKKDMIKDASHNQIVFKHLRVVARNAKLVLLKAGVKDSAYP